MVIESFCLRVQIEAPARPSVRHPGYISSFGVIESFCLPAQIEAPARPSVRYLVEASARLSVQKDIICSYNTI